MKEKHTLEQTEWGVIPISYYRGCLITKLIGGYSIFGKKYLTPQEVDEVIDKNLKVIEKSILVTPEEK